MRMMQLAKMRLRERGDRPARAPVSMADGTLEALKWLGLILMALDHVNKYLLGGAWPVLYMLGRLVMPIFGFVLAYNLARPRALESGVHARVMKRLFIFGALATPSFVGLVGWWPLNILFMLLLATALIWLLEQDRWLARLAAAVLFLFAGAFVEFWWFGVAYCVAAWTFCRHPSVGRALLLCLVTLSLFVVNRNLGALAAMPLLWTASHVEISRRRSRWLYYASYPGHLALIYLTLQWR